ncbi:MAG: CBS domain-containing protein [Thermoleophilaceae bacterium]|nr:CBS domain-containing protein [Thermoleophilaceae bacterium]
MEAGSINTTVLTGSTVADAMGAVHLVLAKTPITVASDIFRENHGRALIVDTGDDSPSIFTEFDVVKMVAAGVSPEGKTVADFHTRTAVAAKPSWSLERALHTMMVGQFRHLIVVDKGQLVGMLAMRDILDLVVEHDEIPEAANEAEGDTVEIASVVPDDSARLLHNLRRSAKQHWSAIQCDCELDWIEVVIGQAEERTDLDASELQELWEQRPDCPALNSMGGGGD